MGDGWAILVERHSYDNHLWWTVVLDDGGGAVTFENPDVRFDKVFTFGRKPDPTFKQTVKPFRSKPCPPAEAVNSDASPGQT
jgi:hypothetical protein